MENANQPTHLKEWWFWKLLLKVVDLISVKLSQIIIRMDGWSATRKWQRRQIEQENRKDEQT